MTDRKQKALALPLEPGVYLMKDKTGAVIYVGKAKQLKSRVSQYFQDHKHDAKTRRMVANIDDFDVIVVNSEREALVLEASLIVKYKPKYNIALKRIKGFPYIKVSAQEEFPKLSTTLKWEKDGNKYYGPYMSRTNSEIVLQKISEAMKLPTCKYEFPRDIGKKPCLNVQMNRCMGICTGKISSQQYHAIIGNIVSVLEGKYMKVADSLQAEMEMASDELNFELAALLRDRYKAIVALGQRQKVVSGSMADCDVVGLHEQDGRCCVAVLHYADGVVFDKHTEVIDAVVHGGACETMTEFVKQFYLPRNHMPRKLYLSHDIDDRDVFAAALKEQVGHTVEVNVPQRGQYKEMTDLAVKNAREQLEWMTSSEEKTSRMLESLQKTLALDETPKRIEACDISNTGDVGIVGAMTVFIDGKAKRSEYKLFKVKDVTSQDDYHSMQEVLTRRFKRLQEQSEGFANAPDLLLVDGGSTHAAMARKVVREMGFDIPVFGMAKDAKHRTRALVTPDGDEIGLLAHLFSFIGRIQEETHRFAIQFHRNQRGKASYSSILDKIEGVGPARRAALLTHFKSMKALRAASLDELCVVVPYPIAKTVHEFLGSENIS
ncbi:MAG: excinuclease ABC subunit UvrC [Oscillospiraceae bacterium]|nr:excinuclease ABC subunit UvrC [Oscillospiraceae bacterium]